MKKKCFMLILAVMLSALLAGGLAAYTLAEGKPGTSSDAPAVPEKRIERTFSRTLYYGGFAFSASAPKLRTSGIGGFSGSYGAQLGSGSFEKTVYDGLVSNYVTNHQTGSLEIPCGYSFSGTGEWENSDVYMEANEDLNYAMASAYSALVYDYPELFWVRDMSYETSVSVNISSSANGPFSGNISTVSIWFTEIYPGASEQQSAFDAEISRAVSTIISQRKDATQYQTLKAIHDYVCEKITYPYDYSIQDPSLAVPSYHSAAGVFLNNGIAVCEGYAKSFMILCRKFNIPAILVVGDAGGAHMWNYVQVRGKWYAVDTTWDDTVGAPAAYTYFMIGSGTVVPGGTFGSTRVLYTRFDTSDGSMSFDYPILNGIAYEPNDTSIHNWVAVSEIKPTCTEQGRVTYKCSICGETSYAVLAALGHTYHDKKYIYNDDATVLHDGTKTPVCDNGCGMMKAPVTATGTKLTPTISLNASSLKLKKGQSTKALKVSGLARGDAVKSWESLNTSIVKVSKSGKITAQKKTGTAKIRVTLLSGLKKTIKVTVQAKTVATSKISGIAKSLSLSPGASLKLSPTLSPITSQQKVTYKSSNKKVVSVSSSGKITAKKKGKATITVKSGKKSVKCKVTVE